MLQYVKILPTKELMEEATNLWHLVHTHELSDPALRDRLGALKDELSERGYRLLAAVTFEPFPKNWYEEE